MDKSAKEGLWKSSIASQALQYRGCFKHRLSHFSKLAELLQNEMGVES